MTDSLGRLHECYQYRVRSEGYMIANIEALEHPRSECVARVGGSRPKRRCAYLLWGSAPERYCAGL